MNDNITQLKQQAAEHAVAYVQSGMVVGLGHGSTALLALRRIAQLLRDGVLRDIRGIPCSRKVAAEAARLGMVTTTLADCPVIDLTIDGADEVAPNLDVIKGGGGALLREKIVAQATRREVIVVDDSKLSPRLGTKARVPVEVLPFGWRTQANFLSALGATWTLRRNPDNTAFITDNGNIILDCDFGPLAEPETLAAQVHARAGIIAHGLFLGLAAEVIVAGVDGIRRMVRE
ncbi:MAG: ribose-5-phosphate isomerase RpiA [Armatimonadota bacterium]